MEEKGVEVVVVVEEGVSNSDKSKFVKDASKNVFVIMVSSDAACANVMLCCTICFTSCLDFVSFSMVAMVAMQCIQ